MNYIDYICLGFVAIGFILGYKDGFIRKIVGLTGLVVAIFLSFQFYDLVSNFIAPLFGNDYYLSDIIAGLGIFVIILTTTNILKRIIHPTDKVNKMLNQILGGLTGSVQMMFFLSGFFLLINLFHFPKEPDKDQSLMYKPVYQIIPTTIQSVFGNSIIAKDYIKKRIEKRDLEDNFVE